MSERYLVAGCRPWARDVFDRTLCSYPGTWEYAAAPEELAPSRLTALNPRRVFFLHWSWIVPDDVVSCFECICFHMTDVPYGRGGSPLQNLILAGHRTTKLTALRMTSEVDAGPVYLKRDLSLEGRAQDIYVRMSELAAAMIRTIIDTDQVPVPQQGAVTRFRRRRPEESAIPETLTAPAALYDFIRMLDADGYPRAFIDHGEFRHEYRNAHLDPDGTLQAEVTIVRRRERARS